MRLVPVVAALMLVTAGIAQAAPAPGSAGVTGFADEHVLGTAEHYEVGGTTLRVYGADGSVAVEDNRVSRTLRFGTAVSSATMVSGASRAGSRFLFDGIDLDVDNADGTRTLTLGIGAAQASWVAPLRLTVHHAEVPVDLTPSGAEIITMEPVDGVGIVLRGYPASPFTRPHVLATYPAALGGLGALPALQYEGALRFGSSDLGFPLAYGDDRLYSVTESGTIVSAARGGRFSPVQAPDGSIADGLQLSADGVGLVHTFAGYWLVKRGQFTLLPDAWFDGLSLNASALSPGGRAFAFGISAPLPSVPTQVITVDLTSGARRTYSLLDVKLPSIAGLAYSVRHPGQLYLLRNSHPISIHQPVTTQLQALDLGAGTPAAIGSAIPEFAPRLFSADVF
ncbi:hypothetical protein [Kutzneria sp. CA-103260]|uniref:hypothetical protein n=1 Tax=Kutzneria sp. CA-103260 TaxID=2802641 RepID=UPI001BA5E684|nr:hypothetical protein [Kutzneria sp. CA-103260]QUQ70454.1 hypothetical protein JJ691_82330 [Kutzneria sp. CA-103260]